MKLMAFVTLISTGNICQANSGGVSQTWLTYTGAWFTIQYPSVLDSMPINKSPTSADAYDGVKFVAEKDGVVFYVYSPQWSGKEDDYKNEIAANPVTEKLEVDEISVKDYVAGGKTIEKNAITIRVIKISAKNNSYKRTYEILENSVTTSRLIFGFKYPDAKRLHSYRPLYDIFKHSIVQFAD